MLNYERDEQNNIIVYVIKTPTGCILSNPENGYFLHHYEAEDYLRLLKNKFNNEFCNNCKVEKDCWMIGLPRIINWIESKKTLKWHYIEEHDK